MGLLNWLMGVQDEDECECGGTAEAELMTQDDGGSKTHYRCGSCNKSYTKQTDDDLIQIQEDLLNRRGGSIR